MFDPSESRLSRIGRWAFWILLVGGVILYEADFDLNKAWTALAYGLAAGAAVLAIQGIIQGVIVDPILAKLRELEYKIDRLSRRKTPLD